MRLKMDPPSEAEFLSLSRPASIDTALKRLSGALDQLEAATERVRRSESEQRDVKESFLMMQDDRNRLANELDAALDRARSLETAADDVALRLGRAGATLRRLLASTMQDVTTRQDG